MTAIQPIHGISDPNRTQQVQTNHYNLPVNHSSLPHAINANYAASAETVVFNNADLNGYDALNQNKASREQIEQLIGNSKDILQILFLVLLSSTENVTTATANTANVITSLKGVSNTLSQAASGMEAYYNFLTKATNVTTDGKTPGTGITNWLLTGSNLLDCFMNGDSSAKGNPGTPCDSSTPPITYSLKALKTAIEQITGKTIDGTESNATIMGYIGIMKNVLNSNLIKINGAKCN